VSAYYSPIHDGTFIDGEFVSVMDMQRMWNAHVSSTVETILRAHAIDWRFCFRGGGE